MSLLLLVALPVLAGAEGLSAARAGSENRSFSKAVADKACKSSQQNIERIDRALENKPYGINADRLRQQRARLREQQESLRCGQSIR